MLNRLEIRGLSNQIVGPLDLALVPGECVAISGASGSGKTLMLRAIADLDPHGGEVLLDGQSADGFKAHEWRYRVGLLPAESQWWAETVGEHFPAVDAAALTALGLPLECLGWEVARCSTGERQRLALLRLLGNRPTVLLLDEPTASLDEEATARVEAMIEAYRDQSGAAVIWVSHSPAQVGRVAGRRLRMTEGRLQEVAV